MPTAIILIVGLCPTPRSIWGSDSIRKVIGELNKGSPESLHGHRHFWLYRDDDYSLERILLTI